MSRPALATPFDIEVHQDGGFDGPVRIAVDQEYLRMWDENGLVPAPSAETVMGPWVVWEFDPPIGDTLLVTYDARIEPAAQEGRSGAVAVLDDDDADRRPGRLHDPGLALGGHVEIVIRASIIFFFLLLLTRGMKKRTLARHGPVRDAAARHARRHRAAGRHPGGLLAHRARSSR